VKHIGHFIGERQLRTCGRAELLCPSGVMKALRQSRPQQHDDAVVVARPDPTSHALFDPLDLTRDYRLRFIESDGFDLIERPIRLGQSIEGQDPARIAGQIDAVVFVDHHDEANVTFTQRANTIVDGGAVVNGSGGITPELRASLRRDDYDHVVRLRPGCQEVDDCDFGSVGMRFQWCKDHAVTQIVCGFRGYESGDRRGIGPEVGDEDAVISQRGGEIDPAFGRAQTRNPIDRRARRLYLHFPVCDGGVTQVEYLVDQGPHEHELVAVAMGVQHVENLFPTVRPRPIWDA
jgi:hypothetical protein